MKNLLRSKLMLILFFAMFFSQGMWAAETFTVTFNPAKEKGNLSSQSSGADEVNKEGVTIKTTNGLLGNGVNYRTYKGSTFSISSTVGNIIKVTFVSAGSKDLNNFSSDVDKYEVSSNNATWEGEATVINLTASAVIWLSSVEVTVEEFKTETSMSFDVESVSVVDNQAFTLPTATLKANGSVLANKTITYTSSDTDKVSVDENTGEIKLLKYGTSTITASFAEDDDYEGSSASYSITFQKNDDTVIFYESFDTNSGTGGNDGVWSGNISSNNYYADNEGWSQFNENGAKECVRFGLEDKSGKGVTPELTRLNGNAVLTFKAGSWKGKNSVLKLSISEGSLDVESISLEDGAWKEYTVYITNGSPKSRITFENTGIKKQFFLDEVKVKEIVDVFYETKENTPVAREDAIVSLARTLSSEYWNTFCVPFDLSAEQIEKTFGCGTVITEFSGNVADGVMAFNKATEIKAGVPYLIKPANTTANPIINGVTISEIEPKTVSSTNGYSFVGIYNPTDIREADNGQKLFVTASGAVKKPSATSRKLKGMRAYITIPTAADAKSVSLSFDSDNGTTDINNVATANESDAPIYNLSGQRMNGRDGLAKGLYVQNGRKFIVR